MTLGAALSYYTVFSLPPLLLIVIAVAGLLFGGEAASGRIVKEFQGFIRKENAAIIQAMVERKAAAPTKASPLFLPCYSNYARAKIAWVVGGSVTALLFTIGKFVIGWCIARSATASGYGAAGSLVLILVWIYYSSQIVFFGAEFIQVYAN